MEGVPEEWRPGIERIMRRNREALRKVGRWIDEEAYRGSVCGYGLPEPLKKFIDTDCAGAPTYTDVILLLSALLKKKIYYLEIGVSLGKNFFQAVDYLEKSMLFAFDIERINPVLESFLDSPRTLDQWDTAPRSRKKDSSTLVEYAYPGRGNRVLYLNADLHEEDSWKRLSGLQFNLIFSDAVHSADSVLEEFRMIDRYGLLDPDEFIMVWDDLAGPMVTAFDSIWYELSETGARRMTLRLDGWLGGHEPPHQVGLIMKTSSFSPV